jgi:hypothetical protein
MLLCACTPGGELGWSIVPPAGWTKNPTAGEQVAQATRDAFFAAVRPDVSATVHRSPTGSQFIVVMLTMPPTAPAPVLETLVGKRKHRTRVDDSRTIVDLEVDALAPPNAGTIQTVRYDDLQHVIVVTCDATGEDLAACRSAVESVDIDEATMAGFEWYWWIVIAGVFLLTIGVMGWRMEHRNRHP